MYDDVPHEVRMLHESVEAEPHSVEHDSIRQFQRLHD
jgi:hypothetical protein